MDLVSMFERTCLRRSDAVALWWHERSWRFEELRDAVRRVAGGLRARGVERGDRVAVFLPNGPDNVFAHWGVQVAGAVRVPVNAAYTDREAAYPVEAAGCKLAITDEPRRGRVPCETVTVAELLESRPAEAARIDPAEVALIAFTSGTTALPKKVPLTHANLVSNIRALVDVWEWTERDVLVLSLPLMHLHGLANGLHGWIASGCTLVLLEKFDAERVLAAIERRRGTMFFGVPAMCHRLVELGPRGDLSTMRLWVTGSAPLDRALEDRFREAYGKPVVNRYGLSETVMIAANPARDPKPGSVGRILPGTEVRFVDGEICVRGPGVGKVEVDAEGFFHTGDLGRLEDGWLYITGRAADFIKCGGTKMSPLEIEEVLLEHPAVAEAAVFGALDEAMGEVPWAVVVPRGAVAPEEIAAWTEGKLAKFKRPRRVILAESLPRNAMQKLDRKRLKELYGHEGSR